MTHKAVTEMQNSQIEDLISKLEESEAEVERLKAVLEISRTETDALDTVIVDLVADVEQLKAEVERLKTVIAQEIDRYSSLVRHAGEIKSNNLDLRTEVERLKVESCSEAEALRVAFELLAERPDEDIDSGKILDILDRIDAKESLAYLSEMMRLRAHTWQQERAAIVAWMNKQERFPDAFPKTYSRRIERGEHWPEGRTPNGGP